MRHLVKTGPNWLADPFFGEFARLFNHAKQGEYTDNSQVETSDWYPSVDIKETATAFVIHADIPGVNPKNVEVSMDESVLTIKGERSEEQKDEQDALIRVERSTGSFYRRFSLPDTVDAEAIKASGKNGVITIEIPKKEKVQPRRIEVEH